MSWAILLIPVAVSIDGLVVGAAYAARRIHLGPLGLLIIGATSAAMVTLAILGGSAIAPWLPAVWSERVGGLLLVGVGVSFWLQRSREPSWADRDHSGAIDPREAVVLGMALATDAFAAGLGAAVGGWAGPWLPAAVGIAQMTFVFAGRVAGARALAPFVRHIEPLPALLLIVLGVTRML